MTYIIWLTLLFGVGGTIFSACSMLSSNDLDRSGPKVQVQEEQSTTIQQHQLTFAANSALDISNQKVDGIIREMNEIIRTLNYAWDVPCEKVEFIRAGDVISQDDLPLSGPFERQVARFQQLAPSANVLLVASVGCGSVQSAAGCGNIGSEPMVVALRSPRFEAMTLLHERGHNVGLSHSAEAPNSDREVAENVGMRFMFWRLGIGHFGDLSSECTPFSKARFSSIVSVPITSASSGANGALLAGAPSQTRALSLSERKRDFASEERDAAHKAGLTLPAFRVIAPPLVDGALPIEEISRLTPNDIESIRGLLRGSPNDLWLNACYVLSIAGGAQDIELIKKALTAQPHLSTGTDRFSTGGVPAMSHSNLIALKLGATDALGILANRIADSEPHEAKNAVDTIFGAAHLSQAAKLIGPGEAARSLSQSAQYALALPKTNDSKRYLAKVMDQDRKLKKGGLSLKDVDFSPLDEEDIDKINSNILKLQNNDILTFLKNKRR